MLSRAKDPVSQLLV